jgi:ribonuclease R
LCQSALCSRRWSSKTQEALITKSALEQTAEHITHTEQNSAEAERESRKIKLIEFFQRSVNTNNQFEGIITSVSNHGFFVELTASMAFGFVHIHSLKDDIYRLNESATELRGRRTNQVYCVGDKVMLRVESVDIFKRQIDFVLAESLQKTYKSKRGNRRRR